MCIKFVTQETSELDLFFFSFFLSFLLFSEILSSLRNLGLFKFRTQGPARFALLRTIKFRDLLVENRCTFAGCSKKSTQNESVNRS